jgi:CheY-like chemotaxis protein
VEYASDGIQALEHVEAKLPLAVVTDLQMPDMDGMQLVKAVQRGYPNIPVILITGYGSEELALEALLVGAADYVPKSRLATDLVESLNSVLSLKAPDRPHKRLAQCLRYQQMRYELDNDMLLIPPLVEHFQYVAMDLAVIDQANATRFARSIMESLRNAIYHGNLELPFDQIKSADQPAAAAEEFVNRRRQEAPYKDRRVYVDAVFSPEGARIKVRDEGPGFDPSGLPDVLADPSRLTEGERRGLVLIRMFMDDVSWNPSGNEITLFKQACDSSLS